MYVSHEDVVRRLAALGYQATEGDGPGISYSISKCEAALLAEINHKELPDGLFFTLIDMAAGAFLREKLASGTLKLEGMDFSSPVKTITEGDVSVTFAGSGSDSPEARFLSRLAELEHPPEGLLAIYRRLRW